MALYSLRTAQYDDRNPIVPNHTRAINIDTSANMKSAPTCDQENEVREDRKISEVNDDAG